MKTSTKGLWLARKIARDRLEHALIDWAEIEQEAENTCDPTLVALATCTGVAIQACLVHARYLDDDTEQVA